MKKVLLTLAGVAFITQAHAMEEEKSNKNYCSAKSPAMESPSAAEMKKHIFKVENKSSMNITVIARVRSKDVCYGEFKCNPLGWFTMEEMAPGETAGLSRESLGPEWSNVQLTGITASVFLDNNTSISLRPRVFNICDVLQVTDEMLEKAR